MDGAVVMKDNFLSSLLKCFIAVVLAMLWSTHEGEIVVYFVGGAVLVALSGWILYLYAVRHRTIENAFRELQGIPDLTEELVQDVICALGRLSNEKSRHHSREAIGQLTARLRGYSESGDYTACANAVADAIGLFGYRFHVIVEKLPADVGGCTVPNDFYGEVEIKISTETIRGKDRAIAVICHEVGHQLLRNRNLECVGEVRRNEMLVDIACVYFGLGPIMLNGSEWLHAESRRVGDEVHVDRQSVWSGYALPSQLALAYDLVTLAGGTRMDDRPEELEGVSREIFAHYRGEMRKLGCDMDKAGTGCRAIGDVKAALEEAARRRRAQPRERVRDANIELLKNLDQIVDGNEFGCRGWVSAFAILLLAGLSLANGMSGRWSGLAVCVILALIPACILLRWAVNRKGGSVCRMLIACRDDLLRVDMHVCNAVKMDEIWSVGKVGRAELAKVVDLRCRMAGLAARMVEPGVKRDAMLGDVRALKDESDAALEFWREVDAELRRKVGGEPARGKWPTDGKVVIKCFRCESAMRIPVGMDRVEVTCPTCGYSFDYSTSGVVHSRQQGVLGEVAAADVVAGEASSL